MDCPQCGGTLDTYALSDREASVCEDCGYVGIAAEHRGEPRSVESWDNALRRFYRAHESDSAPSVDLQPPLSRPAAESTESWDDALQRFYARQASADTDDETAADENSVSDETVETDDTERTGPDEPAETDDAQSDAEAEVDAGQ